MERRKVQQTGSSTYTISLPKQWASDHGIEPGMQLALCPGDDGSLVIGADQTADGGTPVVDVADESPAAVRRAVERCYGLGYDRVRFVGDGLSSGQRRAITTAANSRTGLQIVGETDDGVTVGCLLDTTEVSIDRAVMQLQYVALSMQTDAATALTTADEDLAAYVTERRRDAERRAAVIERYFERTLTDQKALNTLGLGRPALFDYRVAADRLGRIAVQAAELAPAAGRLDESPPDEWLDSTASYARCARTHTEDAVAALLDGDDSTTLSDLRESGGRLLDDLDEFDRALYESGRADAFLFGQAVDTLRRVVQHGDAIAARATAARLRASRPDEK
ncbi:Phosphate uptake regulator [Halogranum amylolyticum]|uniref:Phosphate uptake regulator n=1 Tax=Halogranum amylolyticum TaxID=660520 RepID=A0A1H8W254_9EURY|nr:hypothetical protein [Halogranum amylolyticum]SEP21705.1 Phosphate uptake regulator [Halogranum amylolyticum]